MTTRRVSRSLADNMGRTIVLDLLMLLGLALLGVSVYLWLGLPAMLAYAGAVLVIAAAILSQAETGTES